MEVSPISGSGGSGAATTGLSTPQTESLRLAASAARQLNGLDIENREFAVLRDPQSNRFVLVVRDKSTGTVLDQFPPEDIIKLLSQLSPVATKQTGETQE
jgi:hypothetical protein